MTPDDGWQDSQPELVERISAEIAAAPDRRITFARFMQRALTEPDLGYYATSAERPTRSGDFLTAAELHPFFGHCIARFLEGAAARAGRPAQLSVREFGAGSGTLERDVRAGLTADDSPLSGGLAWMGIDVPGRGRPAPPGTFGGVVLANEYLDALPVHRLVVVEGELREAWVAWRDDRFAEVIAPLSDASLAGPVVASKVDLQDGQRLEVCPAASAWLTDVAALLDSGIILVIDYGHAADRLYGPRRSAGSLVTYRGHVAGDDPFTAVGQQDITAHVDISALERAASAAGLRAVGHTSQAEFLTRLGLGDMLGRLGRQPDTDMGQYTNARAAVARLVDPRHLGGFRVIAWERPGADPASVAQPLPGFVTA